MCFIYSELVNLRYLKIPYSLKTANGSAAYPPTVKPLS